MQPIEHDYQNFFDHAIEGIFRTTPDGAYISANPALARIYGYDSPQELISCLTNIEKQLYVEPNRRQTFIRLIQELGAVSDFESQVYRRDGAVVWISENAHAIYDSNQQLRYYEGFVTDITRRKQAEDMVARSEEKHRALLNALPDLIFRIASDGTYLDCTTGKETVPILPVPEFLGKTVHDILPPDVAHTTMAHLQQTLATGTMQVYEYQLLIEEILHDYEARLVATDETEVLAIVRDITERKRAERLKNEFVSIVSHELRTPLTSIRGSLGLITGTMAENLPPRVRTMVEIAYKNSERLVSLVNDILDIDKIESGTMVFDLKPIELVALTEQAIEANRAYGEQMGISFALKHENLDGLKVRADSGRLMQVLTNLLSNAAKFSPRGGSVQIEILRLPDDEVRLQVRDQGPGIPEEFRGRIFQKFAQADSSATRQKGGTGLGLSISKAIIERLGGKIGFESKVNAGSTFFFDLPILQDKEKVVLTTMQHKPRILICEDTPDLASMLSIMLSYSGFTSDIAYNTTQAKELLAHNQYAAMTLDLVMPGQGGIDLIRELREQESTRYLPIVVVSALASKGREELEGGMFEIADWLDKPVNHERLTAAIKQAISREQGAQPRILHIDDDPDILNVTSAILQDIAETVCATSLQEARQKLEQESFNLIVLDLGLPDGSGLELLPLLHQPGRQPVPIIVFSAKDVGKEAAHKVAAALVKSRTSNQELLDTIRSLIRQE